MLKQLYDENDEMESKEKEQLNRKVLFKAMDLIERFAPLFQNNNIAKQLQKHATQLKKLLVMIKTCN